MGREKEVITARNNSTTWSIHDFKIFKKNNKVCKSFWSIDKGQKLMLEEFLKHNSSQVLCSDFSHLLHVAEVTFAIEDSVSSNATIII